MLGRWALLSSLAMICFAACSYQWNESPPLPPLVGEEPLLSSFTRLNRTTAGTANWILGEDGEKWAAFCEVWRQGGYGQNRGCTGMRLVRLTGPGHAEEFVSADEILLRSKAVYLISNLTKAHNRQVNIHRAGRVENDSFLFPEGPAFIMINDGGLDDTFLYWVLADTTTSFSVRRENGTQQLEIPIPKGVDPKTPTKARLFFSANGETLVVRDADGETTAWATGVKDLHWSLGKRPEAMGFDLASSTLYAIGDDGLRAVALDGQHERLLDDSKEIESGSLRLSRDEAFYVRGGGLYRVPRDGSLRPELVRSGAARLIGLPPTPTPGEPPDRRVLYSHDASTRYAGGAGDGWVDDFPAVERGRLMRFGAGGKRLYFLEHAARTSTVGDLEMIDLPDPQRGAGGGAPVLLGLNVHQYHELPDGRLLAVENHAFVGSWNRLVVIEPGSTSNTGAAPGVTRWVCPATHEYLPLPWPTEVIADVVSGASGYDLYRVPIPPRAP